MKWFSKRRNLLRAVKLIDLEPKWWWTNKKIRTKVLLQLKPSTNITWPDIKEMLLNIPGVKDVVMQGEFTPTEYFKLYIKTTFWTNFEKVLPLVKNTLKEKAPLDFCIGIKIKPWSKRGDSRLDHC